MTTIWTGILLATIGGIVLSLKNIPHLIYNKIKQQIVYTVKVYQYDDLFDMLEKWLSINHTKQYKDVEASLHIQQDSLPQVDSPTKHTLSYKQEDTTFVIKWEGKRILITKEKEKMEKIQLIKDIWFRKYSLTSIKGKSETDSLLKEIIRSCREDESKNTIKVY